jgi:hypothetical protein
MQIHESAGKSGANISHEIRIMKDLCLLQNVFMKKQHISTMIAE